MRATGRLDRLALHEVQSTNGETRSQSYGENGGGKGPRNDREFASVRAFRVSLRRLEWIPRLRFASRGMTVSSLRSARNDYFSAPGHARV
jgi:hypothetical protein